MVAVKDLETPAEPSILLRFVESYPGCSGLPDCSECSECVGSCPVSTTMKAMPKESLLQLHLGLCEEVVRRDDIWHCAACYTCAVHCPHGLSVIDLTCALRSVARRDLRNRAAAFYRAFTESIRQFGRAHEPTITLLYHSRAALLDLPQSVPLSVRMLRTGRISLIARPISGVGEVTELFQYAETAERLEGTRR